MPHYKSGLEAKVGDIVKGKPEWVPEPIVGVVCSIQPNNTSCNMTIDRIDVLYALNAEGKPTSARAIAGPGGCYTVGDFEKIG